jgi:hypothetical protein
LALRKRLIVSLFPIVCFAHAESSSCDFQQAKQLAEDLREWVKALGFHRHKLIIEVGIAAGVRLARKMQGIEGLFRMPQKIVQVTIGQKMGQEQRCASRCLWDIHTDGAVSETYENDSMYCICQVSVQPLYLQVIDKRQQRQNVGSDGAWARICSCAALWLNMIMALGCLTAGVWAVFPVKMAATCSRGHGFHKIESFPSVTQCLGTRALQDCVDRGRGVASTIVAERSPAW